MQQPRFDPPSGSVIGWVDGRVTRATGIPYAITGRFERPVPAPDRVDPISATDWSPASPQPHNPFLEQVLGPTPERRPDEHRQHLSVTMPLGVSADDRLPVMVWIHGGSYANGAGDLPVMDPAALVAEQHVVVVTVTYRLGILGFLGDAEDAGARPANLGLLDQLEAFRWVRRNIHAFGGDPDRVTAFGQSAGADAVAHLMAISEASSLFSRAIIQSAPLGLSRGRAEMTSLMAAAARDIDADTPVDEVVARSARLQRIAAPFGLKGGMPFGTQYGFDPLPDEDDIERAWNAAAPGIDILIGHTSEEGRLFVPNLPALKPWVSLPVVGAALRHAIVSLATWLVYGRSDRRFARRHARAGGRAYRYVISWGAPGNPFGAAHMVDLALLFGDDDAWSQAALVRGATRHEIDTYGAVLRTIWGDFARGGTLPPRGRVPGLISYRRER